MNYRALLKNVPLFSGLSETDLDDLMAIVKINTYSRGEILFSQGDPAHGFFVVLDGKVKVYKLSSDGRERILHIIHPGRSFAEAAIFGEGSYPAYAEPLVPSKLLFCPKEAFLNLIGSNSKISINMIAGLSSLLRQFTSQIEDLTFRDVPSRLARYLVDLSSGRRMKVDLPVSKTQLASNLGTVSETLSRTLRKLAEDDIIKVKGRAVDIIDYERLEDLAQKCKEC